MACGFRAGPFIIPRIEVHRSMACLASAVSWMETLPWIWDGSGHAGGGPWRKAIDGLIRASLPQTEEKGESFQEMLCRQYE